MARAMRQLSKGDEDVRIAHAGRKDEIGEMAAALEVFRTQAIERRQLAEVQERQRGVDAEKHAALLAMADRIETEAAKAMEAMGAEGAEMVRTADEMQASAARTGGSARQAATAAQQVLANAQGVASSSDELSASISEIGTQMRHCTEVVERAVEAGRESRQTIDTLNDSVGRMATLRT